MTPENAAIKAAGIKESRTCRVCGETFDVFSYEFTKTCYKCRVKNRKPRGKNKPKTGTGRKPGRPPSALNMHKNWDKSAQGEDRLRLDFVHKMEKKRREKELGGMRYGMERSTDTVLRKARREAEREREKEAQRYFAEMRDLVDGDADDVTGGAGDGVRAGDGAAAREKTPEEELWEMLG